MHMEIWIAIVSKQMEWHMHTRGAKLCLQCLHVYSLYYAPVGGAPEAYGACL